MANKKASTVKIRRDSFLRIMREKGYTVERLGQEPIIDRSAKTIQRCLSCGEMNPDLLDRIGKFLDVDPKYLSGEYDRLFEEMKDSLDNPKLTHYLWTKTDRFPYSKYQIEDIDYDEYLKNTLLINNVSSEQYKSLGQKKQSSLNYDIGAALHAVIKQYFEIDSQGKPTNVGLYAEGLTLLMGADVKG